MTSTFDAARLFNKDEWSDITIVCGDKKVKCHKMILCTSSDYFAKTFGPDSHFAESKQKEVTLNDDDPTALEALLRYIYMFEYKDDSPEWQKWRPHLEVYKVARKYLVSKLEEKARASLEKLVATCSDPVEIADIVLAILDEVDGDIIKLGEELQSKHFRALKGVAAYRTRIQDDSDFMWKCFDRFEGVGFYPDLVEVETIKCPQAHRWYRQRGEKFPNTCSSCGTRYRGHGSLNNQTAQTFWVKKRADGDIVVPDGTVMKGGKTTQSSCEY